MTDNAKDERVKSVLPAEEDPYTHSVMPQDKADYRETSALPPQERDPEKSIMPPDEADYYTSAMPAQRFAMDIDQ